MKWLHTTANVFIQSSTKYSLGQKFLSYAVVHAKMHGTRTEEQESIPLLFHLWAIL